MEGVLKNIEAALESPAMSYQTYSNLYTQVYDTTLVADRADGRRQIIAAANDFVAARKEKWSAKQRQTAKALFRYLRPDKQSYEESDFPDLYKLHNGCAQN